MGVVKYNVLEKIPVGKLLETSNLREIYFWCSERVNRHTVENIFKLRARILQFFPPQNQPHFLIDYPTRTYPHGEIDNLDPME